MNLIYYTMKPLQEPEIPIWIIIIVIIIIIIIIVVIIIIIIICNNDIKIQEYRNNTLNFSSTTSMLLMSVSILLVIQFASQFSHEKVVAISNYPFVNIEIGSSLQRPLPISFLSQLCSFSFRWRDQQPWFLRTTFRREKNSIRTIGFLKK